MGDCNFGRFVPVRRRESRGSAYVTMASIDSAKKAIEALDASVRECETR